MNKSLQDMSIKLHNNKVQTKELLEQTTYLQDSV